MYYVRWRTTLIECKGAPRNVRDTIFNVELSGQGCCDCEECVPVQPGGNCEQEPWTLLARIRCVNEQDAEKILRLY